VFFHILFRASIHYYENCILHCMYNCVMFLRVQCFLLYRFWFGLCEWILACMIVWMTYWRAWLCEWHVEENGNWNQCFCAYKLEKITVAVLLLCVRAGGDRWLECLSTNGAKFGKLCYMLCKHGACEKNALYFELIEITMIFYFIFFVFYFSASAIC
jgi:hypothetical protein